MFCSSGFVLYSGDRLGQQRTFHLFFQTNSLVALVLCLGWFSCRMHLAEARRPSFVCVIAYISSEIVNKYWRTRTIGCHYRVVDDGIFLLRVIVQPQQGL